MHAPYHTVVPADTLYTAGVASPFVHLAVADDVWPRIVPAFAAVRIDGAADRGPNEAKGDDAALFAQFLFGCVAPDVDKLLLCSREASHFWSFSEDVSGALKLLRAYPELAADLLVPAARAFVAGYLCHLVADEQWMLTIYRPYFGRRSAYAGSREGEEVQWSLHLLLEERQLHSTRIHDLVRTMAEADPAALGDHLLPSIPTSAFVAFSAHVQAQFEHAPGAARARFWFATRETAVGGTAFPDDPGRPDRYLARLPELMATAAAHVPASALAEFERRSVEESVKLLESYLRGVEPDPPAGTAAPTWRAT